MRQSLKQLKQNKIKNWNKRKIIAVSFSDFLSAYFLQWESETGSKNRSDALLKENRKHKHNRKILRIIINFNWCDCLDKIERETRMSQREIITRTQIDGTVNFRIYPMRNFLNKFSTFYLSAAITILLFDDTMAHRHTVLVMFYFKMIELVSRIAQSV